MKFIKIFKRRKTKKALLKIHRDWIKALRSGDYKQGKHYLYNYKTDSFCCLGVFCEKNSLEVFDEHLITRHNVQTTNTNSFFDKNSLEYKYSNYLLESGIAFKLASINDGTYSTSVPNPANNYDLDIYKRIHEFYKKSNNKNGFIFIAEILEEFESIIIDNILNEL